MFSWEPQTRTVHGPKMSPRSQSVESRVWRRKLELTGCRGEACVEKGLGWRCRRCRGSQCTCCRGKKPEGAGGPPAPFWPVSGCPFGQLRVGGRPQHSEPSGKCLCLGGCAILPCCDSAGLSSASPHHHYLPLCRRGPLCFKGAAWGDPGLPPGVLVCLGAPAPVPGSGSPRPWLVEDREDGAESPPWLDQRLLPICTCAPRGSSLEAPQPPPKMSLRAEG